MKINKNIFIGALLVLMMMGVISTVSATDSLNNENLTADDAVSVDMGDSIYSSPSTTNELLGDGETTIYVDSSYDGDEQGTEDNPYKTISAAASAATGGETIFIKNGEYTESQISSLDKQLTFTGESKGGVIIKQGGTGTGFFSTTNMCTNLVFNNLYFKDFACTGANVVISIGGITEGSTNNVTINNCVFDNCGGRYGAVRIFAKFGDVTVDNCQFLNTKATNGKYASAIYFGSAGPNTYTLKNTLINGSSMSGATSTYGAVYIDRSATGVGPTILDNVTISDCTLTGANGLISTKGPINISNSKFINNNVDVGTLASGSLFWIQSGNIIPELNVETTIVVNNTGTKYLVGANGDKVAVEMNYNNIQNNTFGTKVAYSNSYNLDYNYWGSNDQPTGVTVNNWAIEDHGTFILNDGTPLPKQIPSTEEPVIGDDNTTFVSPDGDDNNTGAADSPVATIAKAVEIAKTKSGEIIINQGTYTENNIVLDSDVAWSITGMGNVVIDGNASTNNIFTLTGNPSVTFTNIKFRNNNPRYGGAIYAAGPSQTNLMDLDLTIDHCTFEDISASSRGGAIYLYYAKGNFLVNDSQFINCSASSWGGGICAAYCAYTDALNLVINGSTFKECFANNGASGFLQANTVTVTNSVFNNNTANYDSTAFQLYNATATIDNCIITNNVALKESSYSSPGVAIKITTATGKTPTVTITNSIIENNTNQIATYPAIYVDRSVLDISYSSIINDLSIETKDGTSSTAQGVAIVNNNWWGTNDPSEKVKGNSITMDNWVIMNVEANVSEAIPGDKVLLTVDFNHVNTTAGEIEELTGGAIPKAYKVQFAADHGTFVPASFTIKDGATKTSTYTVGNMYDVVSVSCDEALVEMTFVPEVPPYYGIIYVSNDGDDNNNGSEDAPVATIAKAIELATVIGGSHEIIINEGTYTPGASIVITDDLTITGNGAVVIDADGIEKLIEMPYSSPVKGFTVELNNLALINGVGNQYATVYNYADAYLFMNNVNISDCTGTYLGAIVSTTGNTTITDSVISGSTAGRIINVNVGYNKPITVTLINTTLKDNTAFIDDGSDIGAGYAIIDVSTTTKGTVLNLIDSHITGNTGKLGTVYTTSDKVTMNVNGTEFINNAVLVGNGGAINGYTMNVYNSTFIKNAVVYDQGRDGGAINIGRWGTAVITNSKFVDNSATGRGNTIYNGWDLTINNCAIIDGTEGNVIYHNGEDYVMDAKYNWWGTNDDPSILIGVGEYEDDSGYGYEDCEFDAGKWVVMNVVNNLTSTDSLNINDTIEFTVDFNHYATDSSGTIYELPGSIPEVEVAGNAIKGFFDEDVVTTENNVATLVYTADIGGEEEINIISSNAVDTTLINITEPVILEVVYVGPNGDDSNAGYYDEPVATIAHAIEIAERGKIVIFEGTYILNETLVINKDLDIRGEGTVIIDGNLKRIIENTANLNLTNIVFTNAKLGFAAAILNDGNVTIDGCTFYNNTATASTSGNIINNRKGTMTINNSVFYENVASRGAVASQAGTNLIVNNSEFHDNDMSLSGSSSYYGIIYSTSADTIVENTVFRNNKAKQGAGIWATRSTSATTGSLEVINCTFENNIAEIGTGGAIFASGKVTVDVYDSTFINNTATKSSSGVGGNGGAIYSTGTSDVTVIDSVFIDNAGYEDAGIYAAGNTFDISNSVILAKEGDANYALNGAGATVTAENNFWGDNSKANTNANVAKWVIMSATYDNETGALDITFDKTNSTAGVADYDDVLPDGFTVTVTSTSGALDETLPVIAGQASTTYFTRVSENITVKSGNAEVVIEVIVVPKVIYVARDGDDNNTGCSREDPVATIAKAIELADEGRIVILSGTYTTGDLGIISSDLNITGEGTVIIDAQNANRILYVGEDANVVLTNLIMINGAADVDSGALLGNSNYLTLINCTLADSSAGINNGGAIYNAGKLTIINSTIANNTARVGGAIFNQYSGTELVIINSTFENNVANGDNNNGGGAIFAQQISGLTIINSSFLANEALTTSSGGAIGIIYAEADFTIDGSTFMDNHANGKESTGGGAIYIAGTSNYQRSGSLTITNSLFEGNTADNDGAAIYARATTLDVSNSVIFANKDPAGYAVFGYKTDQVAPTITLNDNWWGSNDDPNDYVGGYNYDPTISRWVILTATNDTPFTEGNTVKITVSLDKYTDGENIGDLATPITIPRDVFIETSFDTIEGVMENGEFTIDYVVPADLRYVEAFVDTGSVLLYKVKYETVIEAVPVSDEKGDTVAINVTVKTTEGDAVGYAAVIASVADGENSTYYADENGNVVIPISGLAPGNYSASIVFEEDYDYLGSSASVDVVINKINTTVVAVAVVGDNDDVVAINVTVSTVDGASVGVVPVDVTIGAGDAVTYETDVDGNVVVPVSGLAPGSYVASVVFAGDDTYAEDSTNVTVTVNKVPTEINLAYDDVDRELTVTFVDNVTGQPLGGATLSVRINGVLTKVKTDSSGQAIVSTADLAPGTYTVAVSYNGGTRYNPSQASEIIIVKADTSISAVYDDDAKELIVTLTNDATGQPLGGATVSVRINGVLTKVKTDSNGQAIVSTADLEPGTYTATVSYNGGSKYNPSKTTEKIIVKADTALSVDYNDSGRELTVTFVDNATGQPIAGATVSVKVNGVLTKVKTDSSGQAIVSTADLAPGTYTATVSYNGGTRYNPSKTTEKITVKANATLSVDYSDVDRELTVTFVDNVTGQPIAGATLSVRINGVLTKVKTDSSGQAIVSTADLAPGTYTATVSYNGGRYNPSQASEIIIV